MKHLEVRGVSVEAHGVLLVVRAGPQGAFLPSARRITVRPLPGEGRLLLDSLGAPADADWTAAAEAAWDYARRLVPRPLDARVEVVGSAPLAGGSAAHALALLFLSVLLGRPLPPHFAVGHMEGEHGSLVGGQMAAAKARAAEDVVRSVGLPAPVPFLYPPVEPPLLPTAELRPVRALDPAHALRALAPDAYAALAQRHDRHRLVARHLPGAFAPLLPNAGPFALLVPVDGEEDAEDLVVGRSGVVLYRRRAGQEDRVGIDRLSRTILSLETQG